MTNFTQKQRAFVEAKKQGLSNRASAISAGYSHTCADQRASALMRHPSIRTAVSTPIALTVEVLLLDSPGALKPSYDNSMEFMIDCMNNKHLPFSLRFEAAKQLLPYQHARKS